MVTQTSDAWPEQRIQKQGPRLKVLEQKQNQGSGENMSIHDVDLTIGSWTRPLSFWSKQFKIKPLPIYERYLADLSHVECVFGIDNGKPVRDNGPYVKIGNTSKRAFQWSELTSQPLQHLLMRLKTHSTTLAVFG